MSTAPFENPPACFFIRQSGRFSLFFAERKIGRYASKGAESAAISAFNFFHSSLCLGRSRRFCLDFQSYDFLLYRMNDCSSSSVPTRRAFTPCPAFPRWTLPTPASLPWLVPFLQCCRSVSSLDCLHLLTVEVACDDSSNTDCSSRKTSAAFGWAIRCRLYFAAASLRASRCGT